MTNYYISPELMDSFSTHDGIYYKFQKGGILSNDKWLIKSTINGKVRKYNANKYRIDECIEKFKNGK